MKTRFNTFDIVCSVAELQTLTGMRVNNVYDVDNKTYLIRLQRGEEKAVLLLESGNRFHQTGFEWPKNMAPSGFSMKMRKHLKNKRLESLQQLGTDRIVDLQFGSGEAAYHVILELYDRGNIILTDYELLILNILRPHTEGEKVKFAVREKYPQDRARESAPPTLEDVRSILEGAKAGNQLRKVLIPHLEYGPALIEHVLLKAGFPNATKIGKDFDVGANLERISAALLEADQILKDGKKQKSKGYIVQKREERPNPDDISEKQYFYSNQEFHPFLYKQHESLPHAEYETFNMAVDEFYSSAEGQKIEMKALQQEREAMKKLENVKKDHTQRLINLEKNQEIDKQMAELITRNLDLVTSAILAIQTAIARQMSWTDIEELVQEAVKNGDPIAQHIKKLKLEINHISLYLTDPYSEDDAELPPRIVDIDLDLTAFANARAYYDQKRSAAKKQQKTIDAQSKAFKSAEKKTKQTLKDVQTITSINKARKVYWFEKFFWFISSENYLVIAGRDQQQNELIVKRYLRPSDIYVHADIHGASSVIIKNPTGFPVPPKTLNEAGTMAICYSVAWEAKVVTNAYWVLGEQVSKTAPTGEYLTTGSFMVRGKKNFLPPSHLILGMSFLFRLEEGHVEKHKGERRVVVAGEEDGMSVAGSEFTVDGSVITGDGSVVDSSVADGSVADDVEIEVLDESDEETEGCKEQEEEANEEDINEEVKEEDVNEEDKENDVNEEDKEEDINEEDKEEDINEEGLEDEIVEGVKEKEITEVKCEGKGASESEEAKNKVKEEDIKEESNVKREFPDTQIKIQHLGGTINIVAEPTINLRRKDSEDGTIVFLGDDIPVMIKPSQRSRGNSEAKNKERKKSSSENNGRPGRRDSGRKDSTGKDSTRKDSTRRDSTRRDSTRTDSTRRDSIREDSDEESGKEDWRKQESSKQQQAKRGQKSKLKKIKEKYRDQDEEERKLRMDILQSSGSNKDSKKGKKGKEQQQGKGKEKGGGPRIPRPPQPKAYQEDGEEEEPTVQADVDMIDALTGVPFADDELLFAVPVIAPYNTLANYKFKVKLTPGTSRRGKAAKTAVNMFLHDRITTQREKDLLKAVKEEQLARNLPGKVKLSAPRMAILRK